ncbi:ABC transporter ATP-binding protein [Paralimibaculum aggregatum]|uniref:ABC transporter ATP-binding protein n=1 Tax=Paralimibaculum aggregatum TaxID=3036245 RepID=A0ABQ6LCQ3_9RHOB|nr:ABC transporter ATP-binding protein [Limibaculum sp. NKW23]GMG81150.1 ABC transporter ATP-binding protein [Limibaculum sp. NKW23]
MLRLEGVTAGYGPVQALFGVDLAVAPGQVVALMGRNGMGKTTTIRAVMGLAATWGGRVLLEGRDLAGLAPNARARLGLGLVPEGRRCFAPLSVAENLRASARPGPWDRRAVEALFPRLAERRGQRAGTLSGGEQQMLAIARALMTNPRILLLDEATEGLAPAIRGEIWSAITRLKAEGEAILLVDKSVRELLPLADACMVLERGRSVWSGPPAALTPQLAGRYLGLAGA